MANNTLGQFVAYLPYGLASVRKDPMRNYTASFQSWASRFVGSTLAAGGALSVRGHTYEVGVAAVRRVIIMTQPPMPVVLFEAMTQLPLAEFAFPKLAPGNYVVLDFALDNSRQALVYDWVVAG